MADPFLTEVRMMSFPFGLAGPANRTTTCSLNFNIAVEGVIPHQP
jgi:hypothetical protein